jgi:putative transcriptional regulator
MRHALRILLPLFILLLGGTSVGIAGELDAKSVTGKLLVADKSLKDSRFARAVIYVVSHDKAGTIGLIINKPLVKLPMADMLRQLEVENSESDAELDVHFGGPLRAEYSFVLHSSDFATAKATAMVDSNFAVSDVRKVLRAMSEHKGPEKSLFAVGYAGWAPEQLDKELERGDWSVIDADETLVFDLPVAEKWPAAYDRRSLKM